VADLIQFDQQFAYPKGIQLLETKEGHYYEVGNVVVPSVTTVLSVTEDHVVTRRWKYTLSPEDQEAVRKAAAYVGTVMHQTIANILLGHPIEAPAKLQDLRGQHLAYRLLESLVIGRLTHIFALEQPLHYYDRCAGTMDLHGLYDKNPTIIDFKSSKGIPQKEGIHNYFLQLAAYALMQDAICGTHTNHGAILLISKQTLEVQAYRTAGREFDNYKDQWKRRLDEYFRMREVLRLDEKDAPPATGADGA
jgi:hypothetical protein